MREKKLNKLVVLRIDHETENQLNNLKQNEKKNQSEIIRLLIQKAPLILNTRANDDRSSN